MIGRSSGTLPTMIQIRVLAPFPGFISGFSGVVLYCVNLKKLQVQTTITIEKYL
jgi:hypothetical protein